MELGDELSRVRSLSNEALLLGLGRSLRTSRWAVAAIALHLGAVEERRLHLLGGYPSMFAYCTQRLGMSEDEAYRRLEVAGLVRRFPRLLGMLAAGQISLSVAALLKARLTDGNHEALLAAVCGKTVAQAREVLADWFPQPDVLPLLRKLPHRVEPASARHSANASAQAPDVSSVATPPAPALEPSSAADSACDLASNGTPGPEGVNVAAAPEAQPATPVPPAMVPSHARTAPGPRASRSIEPLSPERYKLQLTVSSDLKRKLELARDLLRHSVPSGDLASLIERALDLLLEQTTKRRFAATAAPRNAKARKALPGSAPTAATAAPSTHEPASDGHATPTCSLPSASTPARHIPNHVRREVHARDDVRCTWQGPDGVRCNSRAWLEHDRVIPRGLGGTNDATNIRGLCRAHNRLAAEQVYGKEAIARIIARRRARCKARRNEAGPANPNESARSTPPASSQLEHPR